MLLIICDAIWIGTNFSKYKFNTELIQKAPLKIDFVAVGLAYICLFVLLYFITIPLVKSHLSPSMSQLQILITAAKFGGLIGLLVYAIYNLTNKALFKDYSWKITILDSIWGSVLFTFICWIVVNV